MSHQCMQMTPSISCANRCTFCWRGYKAPVSKDWKWAMDEPEVVLKEALEAHHKLLEGFKGNDMVSKGMYDQSRTAHHVALSLTGEPINYPKINELLHLFNKEYVSTFLVTNAQYPEQIRTLEPVTQLYVSLDAPTKEILKDIDRPLFKDFWERLMGSLDALAGKKHRTTIRMTIVKGINDVDLHNYAKLIERGNPDFIEIKGFVLVGGACGRLTKEAMPYHEEVVEFSKQMEEFVYFWIINWFTSKT